MIGLEMIVAFVLGWLVAQVAKVAVAMAKNPKLRGEKVLHVLVKSGGMPSGHAASLVAMTTYVGWALSFNSVAFALAACFTLIVLYDAVNVRWAVGEHGKILTENAVAGRGKKPKRIVEGHTVAQVVVGALIGILVGSMLFLATS